MIRIVFLVSLFIVFGCNERKSNVSLPKKHFKDNQHSNSVLCAKWSLRSVSAGYVFGASNPENFMNDDDNDLELVFTDEGYVYEDKSKVARWEVDGHILRLTKIGDKEVNFGLTDNYVIKQLNGYVLELTRYHFSKDRKINLRLEYYFEIVPLVQDSVLNEKDDEIEI